MGSVVALAGQIGGAKLADGLRRARPGRLSVIVNTGDDYELLGLSISPDVDTMLYTLSGIADPHRGWEPVEETFSFYDMLNRLGGADRIPLGDRSMATQLLRAEALRNERRLTEITLDFCRALDIDARVLPMSDDPVRTQVVTEAGAVRYHEYFFDLQCEPVVKEFFYAGADGARLRLPRGGEDALGGAVLDAHLRRVVAAAIRGRVTEEQHQAALTQCGRDLRRVGRRRRRWPLRHSVVACPARRQHHQSPHQPQHPHPHREGL